MKIRNVLIFITLATFGFAPSQALSQTKVLKGKINIGVQELDLKAGKVYQIKVTGDGFRPQVVLSGRENLSYDGQNFRERNVFRSTYLPSQSGKKTFYIIPQLYALNTGGPFEYSFEITGIEIGKTLLKKDDSLTNNDPPYKKNFVNRQHHKVYPIKMTAGKYYVIDMMRRGGGFGGLDAYLYLNGPDGKTKTQNDDGGKGLNSRIVFGPEKTGTYEIIATGLGNALGDFTLQVRESK